MVRTFQSIVFASALWNFGSLAFCQIGDQLGVPNPLIGRTGTAGRPSIDSVVVNPAQAGELSRSEVQGVWGLASTEYSQRYPGFKAHSSNSFGLNPAFPIPRFIWKLNRNFGLGGLIVPFPVSQDINLKDLPIVILEQENSVDIKGRGTLNGMANIVAGYRFNESFSMGANFEYYSLTGYGDVVPTDSSEPLASFSVKTTQVAVGLGMKVKAKRFSVGLWTNVFSTTQNFTDFSSVLDKNSESTSDPAEATDTGGKTIHSDFLNPIRIGIGVDLSKKWFVTSDVRYTRAGKGQKRYSIVDLKEKPLDSYDTIAVFLGSEVKVNSETDLLFGYFNEPSAVGPGSPGANGKTGFGFMDLAFNLGEPPSSPIWGVGAGARYNFKKVGRRRAFHYQMAVEGGFVFAETSIGVDEDGEQPGAYLAQRYQFPLKFIYRF